MKQLIIAFFALIIALGCAPAAAAQELEVISMRLAEDEPLRSVHSRMDLNGEPCALIKVQLPVAGVGFEGSIVGDTPFKINEYWVYVTDGTKRIGVKCPGCYNRRIEFAPLGVKAVKADRVYYLKIKTPDSARLHRSVATHNYLVMDVEPADAEGIIVTIDGTRRKVSADGKVAEVLETGPHNYVVEAIGYAPASGTFTINTEGKTTQTVKLESRKAALGIRCETPGTDIYINERLAGRDSLTAYLPAGSYIVEGRKESHHPLPQAINLTQLQQASLIIPSLEPICGTLQVDYSPLGATVSLDGVEIGSAPDIFRNITAGKHSVGISMPGYATATIPVTIEEGRTATLSGELSLGEAAGDKGLAKADTLRTTFNVNGVEFKMIPVAGGRFRMGCSPKENIEYASPVHNVDLDDYRIGETEVSQALWEAVMGTYPSYNYNMKCPVENVTYADIQEFIKKLNEITGEKFRLPTEAEWEYAAQGGANGRNDTRWGCYYTGVQSPQQRYANSSDYWNGRPIVLNIAMKETQPVGISTPNPLGIYDMLGNVEEICEDFFSESYYSTSPLHNPRGPETGYGHTVRGGSYRHQIYDANIWSRFSFSGKTHRTGFRLAL